MKRLVTLLTLLTVLFTPAFAGGSKEQFKEVQGKENWHYEYDISKLETGKYNLLIQATDKAGNISVVGPFNVNIDPKSDIPSVTINSPWEGMSTNGKLNIVGTAVDDDGVDFVELKLGAEGEWTKAKGQKFWSYYMDIANLPDGQYTIFARSTDIKGVPSPVVSVSFNLDQYKPVLRVTSQKVGVILTGAAKLSGEIEEANGISAFSYSFNSTEKADFKSSPFEPSKEPNKFTFSLDLNTKDFKDGPQIVWLRAINKLGNEGRQAFLFFVDNTPPQVKILLPAAESASPEPVYLTGMTVEEVGLQSLSWEVTDDPVNKDLKGEIALIPGNPFFTLKLDFSGQNGGSRQIRFTAVDKTGNKGTTNFTLKLDKEADRPVVSLLSPKQDSSSQETVNIQGWIRDDDAVKSLSWSLENGESGVVESSGTFDITVTPKTPGKQRLTLVAKDVNGLESLPVRTEFTVKPAAPSISLDNAIRDKTRKEPFYTGYYYKLGQDQSLTLEGKVYSADRLGEISYSLGPKNERTGLQSAGNGVYTFSINVPNEKEFPVGKVGLKLSVKDSYGNVAEYATALINGTNNLSADGGTFVIADARRKPGQSILLTQKTPLTMLYSEPANTASLKAELVPATADFTVTAEQKNNDFYVITISPVADNVNTSAKVKVRVTNSEAAKTYESEELELRINGYKPTVVVDTPASGDWVSKTLGLKGKMVDPLGFSATEYSLDDGATWKNLTTIKPADPNKFASSDGRSTFKVVSAPKLEATEFNTTVDVSSQEDGNRQILLRALDKAGAEVIKPVLYFKSSTPPEITMTTPPEGISVNGTNTIAGMWKAGAPFKSIEYSDDNKTWTNLGNEPLFYTNIDFSKYKKLPDKFYFRGTDLAGNQAILTPKFNIDLEIDKPKISVQIPGDKEVLRSDFFISGLALDDDGIKEIWYRIDNAPFTKIGDEGANSFSVPVSLADITDTDHTVDVYAVDLNGTKSDPFKRQFTVSRSGPVSKLARPDLNITQKGKVILEGTSEDPNGVAAVFLSFDNGNTFLRMKGAESWNYLLDTTVLADGLYTLFIRAFDKTGAYGDYTVLFSVDNTLPTVSLVSPKDGDELAESVSLEGRGADNLNLKSLKYIFKPLDEKAKTLSGDLPTTGGFTENVDITKLAVGWYNLSLEATDDAGNITYLARNIQIKQALQADRLEIFFPSQGEKISGPFNIEGQFISKKPGEQVALYVNEQVFTTIPVNEYGYFSTAMASADLAKALGEEALTAGKPLELKLKVEGVTASGIKLNSPDRLTEYRPEGPWVRIISHRIGDMITKRPFLSGRIGYHINPFKPEVVEGQPVPPAPLYGPNQLTAEEIYQRTAKLEISLDNGLTFQSLDSSESQPAQGEVLDRGTRSWNFRLQTQTFKPGDVTILLRGTWPDGSVATTRQILVVDEKKPDISLIMPTDEGNFNEQLKILGSANDENGLASVKVVLRKGDKGLYQVPGFIQGMYLDTYALGATSGSVGLGLTFFDQAVKLQGQLGVTPDGRFSGAVAGAKLLANILNLPFSYFFGPDLEFFSMSLAVGANFSWFSMTGDRLAFDGNGVVLGAMITQWEFARFTFNEWSFANSYSFYLEGSFWFISSDVEAGVKPLISLGFRLGLL